MSSRRVVSTSRRITNRVGVSAPHCKRLSNRKVRLSVRACMAEPAMRMSTVDSVRSAVCASAPSAADKANNAASNAVADFISWWGVIDSCA